MDHIWTIIACLLLTTLLIFYWYITSAYNYWKHRGVPFIQPCFPFGTLGDTVMGRKSLMDLTLEQYRRFEGERYFGTFHLDKPVLVLRDPTLIEIIMKSDFIHFCDKVDESSDRGCDLLSYNLAHLRGDEWRLLRQKLSGAFSCNKLKSMLEQISLSAEALVTKIDESVANKEPLLAECIGFTFAQRVIASCAFGIEYDGEGMKSFIQHIKKYTILNIRVVHLINLWFVHLPKYYRYLCKIPAISSVANYFKNLSKITINLRRNSKTKRNDFLQVLLDLKEEDAIERSNNAMGNENKNGNYNKKDLFKKLSSSTVRELTLCDGVITSQLFGFLSQGMESSAMAITFLLCDLAINPDIQKRVQEEIDEVVGKYGDVTYDATQHLTYLDLVIQESVRRNPGVPFVTRICQSSYKVPGSELVLERGTPVLIPTYALHLDPQHHADPELFNPERFVANHYKSSATYLPFGTGPRMCIALNLVILEVKVAVVKIMLKYSVRLTHNTQLPLRYFPKFMPKLLNNAWIEFEPRT